MEAKKKSALPPASPPPSPRLFLRVEDRGRKRCPCLNEAKIGSRVALQRNRQIIPTPRVDVCVRACVWGGAVRKAQPKLFHLGGGHSGANNFKIPPRTHTHVHAHMQTNMLLIPRRKKEEKLQKFGRRTRSCASADAQNSAKTRENPF